MEGNVHPYYHVHTVLNIEYTALSPCRHPSSPVAQNYKRRKWGTGTRLTCSNVNEPSGLSASFPPRKASVGGGSRGVASSTRNWLSSSSSSSSLLPLPLRPEPSRITVGGGTDCPEGILEEWQGRKKGRKGEGTVCISLIPPRCTGVQG